MRTARSAVDATNNSIVLLLGAGLIAAGRGLAGLDEIEAVVEIAEALPDPRRAAAILEDSIEDLERLERDGTLEPGSGEAKEVVETLRASAKGLRKRAAAGHQVAAAAT